MEDIYEKLKAITKEENILKDEPMSKHTTFRTGGNADYYVMPESSEEVQKILKVFKDENIVVLGNGSNVLVTDKGIRGIVVSLRKLNKCEIIDDTMIVECGFPIAKASQIAAQNGLSGLEFACGIPGTVRWCSFYECWSIWWRNERCCNFFNIHR